MKDKKDILPYINGYEFKKEYNFERLHTRNLYNGMYMLGNHDVMDLVKESINVHIDVLEEDIVTVTNLCIQVAQLQVFLEKHKDELEHLFKESLINEFTLEDTTPKGYIEIKPVMFDSNIVYNGEGYKALELLKTKCGDRISMLLKQKAELSVIEHKLNMSFMDNEYLSDEEEIKEDVIKNYNKLNSDNLEKYKKNGILITDKDDILSELNVSSLRDTSWLYNGEYANYIIRTFDIESYVAYYCVTDVFDKWLKIKSRDEE